MPLLWKAMTKIFLPARDCLMLEKFDEKNTITDPMKSYLSLQSSKLMLTRLGECDHGVMNLRT